MLVFVVSYTLIATERMSKVKAALGGAAVVVIVGIVGSEDVFYSHDTGIDWDVIFLLLGMMVIVGVLRQTGVFEYAAIWAAKTRRRLGASGDDPAGADHRRASALLDNVTTVLLIAPVTLLVCERLDVNPVPFLIAEVVRLQHRRRRHPGRRPAEHHHRQPRGLVVQRLSAAHGPDGDRRAWWRSCSCCRSCSEGPSRFTRTGSPT